MIYLAVAQCNTRPMKLPQSSLTHSIEEGDSDAGKCVILKRDIPASARKTIVRNALKCSVLTIIDSHAFIGRSSDHFWTIIEQSIIEEPMTREDAGHILKHEPPIFSNALKQ